MKRKGLHIDTHGNIKEIHFINGVMYYVQSNEVAALYEKLLGCEV